MADSKPLVVAIPLKLNAVSPKKCVLDLVKEYPMLYDVKLLPLKAKKLYGRFCF